MPNRWTFHRLNLKRCLLGALSAVVFIYLMPLMTIKMRIMICYKNRCRFSLSILKSYFGVMTSNHLIKPIHNHKNMIPQTSFSEILKFVLITHSKSLTVQDLSLLLRRNYPLNKTKVKSFHQRH